MKKGKYLFTRYLLVIASSLPMLAVPSNAQQTTDMLNDTTRLDEVVVVGYGTQTREQLTKSVSSIGKADIERLAPTAMSIQDILSSGLVKGVLSIQNTGEPSSSPTINVRGTTSPYPQLAQNQSFTTSSKEAMNLPSHLPFWYK